MKKRYVLAKDLEALQNQKGQVLKTDGSLYLIQTQDIYTVWIPETGFIIENTFYLEEAMNTFKKYQSLNK